MTATPQTDPSTQINTDFVVVTNDGRQVNIAADVSILESLRSAGLVRDSSCEAGSCGTCEVRVLAGIPDHRDLVLDEDEQAANDVMMICVSRSLSPELRLDV